MEVVVALVILEVGLLGSLGVLTLATRTLERARRLEYAVAMVEGVADSLGVAPSPSSGGVGLPGGDSIWWSVRNDGAFKVVYGGGRARGVRVTVSGRLTRDGAYGP